MPRRRAKKNHLFAETLTGGISMLSNLKKMVAPVPNYRVRQDRHIIEDLDFTLEIHGAHYKVVDFSFFGVAIRTDVSESLKSKDGINAILYLEGHQVQVIKLKYARQETKDNHNLIAFKTIDSPIQIENLFFLVDAIRLLKELEITNLKYESIPGDLKLQVYELRMRLEEIRDKVEGLSANKVFPSFAQRDAFEQALIGVFGPLIKELLDTANRSMQKSFVDLRENDRPLAFDFYRAQLRHLLYESVFAERSLKKPRGYAGDYEMMNLIYRNEGIGRSLFSRCMEQGIQLHSEPGAVRNRAAYLKSKILQTIETYPGPVTILSVACGPAMEVQYAIEEMTDEDICRTDFYLLDQDEDALKEAEKNIRSSCIARGVSPNIHLLNHTMKSVIAGGLQLSGFTLIYSAGLFDYFTDPVACHAANSLASCLGENGRLIIGNFDVLTTNQFAMMAIFDWHLVLRSREQMNQMYLLPGTRVNIESEPNGINLFCVLEKIS
jgi:hypothetical protein